MNQILILLIINLVASITFAAEINVPKKIIDSPTAGNLARGYYDLDFKIFPNGGLLGEISFGLTDNIYLGMSYGGNNVIGRGKIQENTKPGVLAQIRFIEENLTLPAIALGYNNQGIGIYNDSTNSYAIQAKGIYAVASKNFRLLGNFGLHGGISYRIEQKDTTPNVFLMSNVDINNEFSLAAEYDAALNNTSIKKGYLNFALSWIFGSKLRLEINFKNILENKKLIDANREIRIVFMDHF